MTGFQIVISLSCTGSKANRDLTNLTLQYCIQVITLALNQTLVYSERYKIILDKKIKTLIYI